MPVEIKEVVIRAVITQENNLKDKAQLTSGNSVDKDLLINSCVQEVMRILKRTKDR